MPGFQDANGIWRETHIAQRAIPSGQFSLAAGAVLAAFADGASAVPGLAVDNSEGVGVRWNNNATLNPVFATIPLPNDRQPNTDITVVILAAKSGATVGDATRFTIGAFMVPTGVLQDADSDAGGDTGPMVGNATAKTVQRVTRTIAAADIPNATIAVPALLTLTLQPKNGTLGTDDVTAYSVWLEYTKITAP